MEWSVTLAVGREKVHFDEKPDQTIWCLHQKLVRARSGLA